MSSLLLGTENRILYVYFSFVLLCACIFHMPTDSRYLSFSLVYYKYNTHTNTTCILLLSNFFPLIQHNWKIMFIKRYIYSIEFVYSFILFDLVYRFHFHINMFEFSWQFFYPYQSISAICVCVCVYLGRKQICFVYIMNNFCKNESLILPIIYWHCHQTAVSLSKQNYCLICHCNIGGGRNWLKSTTFQHEILSHKNQNSTHQIHSSKCSTTICGEIWTPNWSGVKGNARVKCNPPTESTIDSVCGQVFSQ